MHTRWVNIVLHICKSMADVSDFLASQKGKWERQGPLFFLGFVVLSVFE